MFSLLILFSYIINISIAITITTTDDLIPYYNAYNEAVNEPDISLNIIMQYLAYMISQKHIKILQYYMILMVIVNYLYNIIMLHVHHKEQHRIFVHYVIVILSHLNLVS